VQKTQSDQRVKTHVRWSRQQDKNPKNLCVYSANPVMAGFYQFYEIFFCLMTQFTNKYHQVL